MNFILRSATQSDQRKIKSLIRKVRINPFDLDWRCFVLAVAPAGEIIGCGQVKTHQDGSRELASIAVVEDYRGEGIASAIISHLINIYPRPLYLTCRAELQSFYQNFGFSVIQGDEMPHYFRRVEQAAKIFLWLSRKKEGPTIMKL